MSNFHVGQKVVCINTDSIKGDLLIPVSRWLIKGNSYIIRWIGEFAYEPWRQFGIGVRLEGIVREPDGIWDDLPFSARRFRPVIERETSIEIFACMLTPADKVDA